MRQKVFVALVSVEGDIQKCNQELHSNEAE